MHVIEHMAVNMMVDVPCAREEVGDGARGRPCVSCTVRALTGVTVLPKCNRSQDDFFSDLGRLQGWTQRLVTRRWGSTTVGGAMAQEIWSRVF